MKHKQAYIKLASLRLAINYVLRNRSMTKLASEWTNPLIGAGVGMGLGYLLSPEKHKLLGTLGGGLLGGAAGYGFNKLRGNNKPSYDSDIVVNKDGSLSIPYYDYLRDDDGHIVFGEDNKPQRSLEPTFVNIPKKQVDILNNFGPDFINQFRKYTDITNFNDGKEPFVSWKDPNSPWDLGLTPKQQLELYYSGFGGNAGWNAPGYETVPYQNIAPIAGYGSMLGRAYPELSRLNDSHFYTDNNLNSLYDFFEQRSIPDLRDFGNPDSPWWQSNKEAVINLINSLPLAE